MKKTGPVERVHDLMDGRSGFRLTGSWGHVSVLEGGGHICELISNRHPTLNPLWRPPWKTIDPNEYDPALHGETYGPAPDARLLSGIAGHSLSFDRFGPPSDEEIACGQSTHGEAPAVQWDLLREFHDDLPGIEYGALLPQAQIRFSRKLLIDPQEPVIYCEETATSLLAFDRPICWNEHVTFGPPFMQCGATIFDIPAVEGRVAGESYSDRMLLEPDANFTWPWAPAKTGRRDLRISTEESCGQYCALRLDPQLEFGYLSAANPQLRLLTMHVFRRADFPWMGCWEERFARSHAPWSGQTFCRGMEFSSTAFPAPQREIVSEGKLFGEQTYRWLPAKGTARIRFLILMLDIPSDFQGVAEVVLEQDRIRMVERNLGREQVQRVRNFFDREN